MNLFLYKFLQITHILIWTVTHSFLILSSSIVQVQFLRPRETLPPPFRWVYYFAFFMRKLKHCKVQQNDETSDEKKKYVELMNKLIKRNMQKHVSPQNTDTAVD